MKDKTPKIIAVDFDGTLCTNAYPEIGEPIPYSLLYVTRAKAAGHIITLHTCRQGKFLDDAIAWCKARGITFDYINKTILRKHKAFRRRYAKDIRRRLFRRKLVKPAPYFRYRR